MDIRVDANRAWSRAEALELMLAACEHGIRAVEDPLAGDDVLALADDYRALREAGIEVILDEPIRSLAELEKAIDARILDTMNFRVSKNGGLLTTVRMAKLAQSRGVAAQLGAQVGETAILSAAGRHFLSLVPEVRYAEGSNESIKFTRDQYVCEEDLTYSADATGPALAGPGLGLTMIPGRLESLACALFERDWR